MLLPGLIHSQNKSIDSLKQALQLSNDDSIKTKILFEIGRDHWFARNVAEATRYLHKSVALAEKSGHLTDQADAYNLLANVYMKREAFDSAFTCLQYALLQKDKRFVPLIHETYSKLYLELGDYQSSLEHALQAVDGYEKSNAPEFNSQSVYAYLMVGDVFFKLGQHERSFEYYQKAYKKARSTGQNWAICASFEKLAAYYFSKNQLDRAKRLYDTIISIDKNSEHHETSMFSYEGLGNIAMKQQKFDEAANYYKQSLRYALQKGLANNVADFYVRLGSAFLNDDQKDSALHYLQLTLSHALKSRDYYTLSTAYDYLSSMHLKQGDYKQSLASLQLHDAYQDSIFSVEKIKAINNMEVLHRTNQKENEILRLQKIEQEKDFEIKTRNIYIGIGTGLLLTLSTIVLLLMRNYRNRQRLHVQKMAQMKQQQQVASLQSMINGQETERTRIAKDLHDGLGGLFSTVKMLFSTLEYENEKLKTDELFKKSYSLVDTASVELRRIAHNMMPEVLMRLGLINAVKDLCDNINAGKLLKISLEVHGLDKRFNENTEVMLYRIIQELLNNIIKHAQATEVIIQFIKDNNRLSVIVEDNGKGFNTLEADEKTHAGIETIRSRVNYLNGKLTIDSQKNAGTTIMMDFLINEV